jgi:hypothetical protein
MNSIITESWIAPTIVVIALILIIGSLSTFQKSSKMPLRKKGLNDLKETLPRTNKSETETTTFSTESYQTTKTKNSD